ncbi:MAG: hypothetical protein LW823_03970 [Rickettsiales bacterium]|jgi:hypothetical protein|nr:hypothetical protein [Rickettsiales bacterium]
MKQLVVMLGLMVLVACGPVYQTTYEIVPPPTQSGRMCANNCLLAKQNCDQQCQIQRQQCEEIERLRAQSDYLSYLNQQNREGRPIKKDQSDFYRGSFACQRDTCEENCGTNYRICHTNCGGQVIPHTACTAFCE